ncbi:uncharacterized protein DS421_19g668870 [Arachis hypogaea]|uniref:Uncharacterized protein n=1 Tax=Arachis hypogaea TaxID=3818 RepID=A0A6B9VF25_ARAHY|nr:uncharacterized protein DS421_19g668870 [Arachis hypogaea]
MRFIVSHIRGVPQQLMVPVLLNQVEDDAFIVHDLNRRLLTDAILKKRLYFSVRLKLKLVMINQLILLQLIIRHVIRDNFLCSLERVK